MKIKNGFKFSCMLTLAAIVSPVFSANSAIATDPVSATLTILLGDLTQQTIDLLLKGATGARGAIAFADTCLGPAETDSATTGFRGDTGLRMADSSDICGNTATARARNILRGKVLTARSRGFATARSVLTWNGNVVWDTRPNPQANESIIIQNIVLPNPNDVLSASLAVNYEIDIETIESNISQLNNSVFEEGFVEITHFWGTEESFNGSVKMQTAGLPVFEGDLINYSSDFINSENSINASNLVIDDTFSFDINYDDFFNTGQISKDFNGQIIAIASSSGACCIPPIPEPTSTLGLLALGTLGAASTLKRKLKPSKSAEKETTKVG